VSYRVPLCFHGKSRVIASAQTAPVQNGEIVVTAEKRDSSVQKTPISITALRGVDLQRAGLTSTYVNDLYNFGWLLNVYGAPRTFGGTISFKF
jgi:hypothetical protein